MNESLYITNGDGAVDGQIASQDTDGDITQVADKVHDREQQAGQELRFPGRVEQGSIDLVKLFDALGLAVEGLHHHMSAVHFFDVTVDMPKVILLAFEEDL